MRTLKLKSQDRHFDIPTFRYRQSNAGRLLPAFDYHRARGNQIVEHSSDNETVFSSSRKLGGAAKHFIDGSKRLMSVELRVLESVRY